ncbi:MAG: energy-coupled thiamine transporter ThiT [Oscillospiraceae bacterium]|nr:energy-coupled thiamine transporter ThiT [Oscillospiraceae bacterium]
MKNKNLRALTEGAVMVALSIALSFLKIPIGAGFGGFGGSIDLVMVPLIIYAVRYNAAWGLGAGLVFGTIKYFLGGSAIDWVSIIFDYSAAYMFVGFAGLLNKTYKTLPLAALIGCFGRFAVHFVSGVTVYAKWMPEEFMGISGMTPPLYSLLYNGTYMLPNTILAIAVCAALIVPMQKLDKTKK